MFFDSSTTEYKQKLERRKTEEIHQYTMEALGSDALLNVAGKVFSARKELWEAKIKEGSKEFVAKKMIQAKKDQQLQEKDAIAKLKSEVSH